MNIIKYYIMYMFFFVLYVLIDVHYIYVWFFIFLFGNFGSFNNCIGFCIFIFLVINCFV